MNKIKEISHYTIDMNRFNPYEETFGNYNIVERSDYRDMIALLPPCVLGSHKINKIIVANYIQIDAFADIDGEDHLVHIRFEGEGMMSIYMEEGFEWFVAFYDNHNWKLKDEDKRYAFYDLLDSFVELRKQLE